LSIHPEHSFLLSTNNYWTGPVYSALAFYLIPVIFIIWNVGRPAGILISIAGAFTWVLTELISIPSYPHIIAIVKTIVETNGGRIWVNSIYGKGSTFAFTLPKYLGEISSND
jgi:hypothetical protein